MDCRSCEKYINEYLDKELSKEEEKKFQKHLTNCQTCKVEFDLYMIMSDQLAGVEELSPKDGFEDRILSQLEPLFKKESPSELKALSQEERTAQIQTNKAQIDEGESPQRNRRKDLVLVFAYFFTLFVVLNVLRNGVFQSVDWISGIMVTGRVFRDVFDGLIFRGIFALFVVYPIRLFHWAGANLSQMSLEGRMIYSLVIMNLLLIITFSHIMLRKLAKGQGKNAE